MPTDEELSNVVKSLANGKSPGPDDIITKFYKQCLPVIKVELARFSGVGLQRKISHLKLKKGVITLIHKKAMAQI